MNSNCGLNILIVDDDELLRMSLLQVLTMAGHHVRSSDGGQAALCEMERETPDLLLTDLNMPGLSGFELLFAVRGRFPGIQLIAMSGAYFGDDVPPGVCADAFYEKGRGVSWLMQIVGDIAGSSRCLGARNSRPLAVP